MVKQINIVLSNKLFYTFILVGIIFLLAIGVYAYNSAYNNPAVMGHSADEIEGVCKTDGTGCPSAMSGERLNCKTFEFDALDQTNNNWRWFNFTLPYDCKQPDQGGFGCSWQIHAVKNDNYPYSSSGLFYMQYIGNYKYLQTESYYNGLGHYNVADNTITLMIEDGINEACQVYDHYYTGSSYKNDEGGKYNVFGFAVYPNWKCFLQICELKGVTNLSSGYRTYN